MELPLFGADSDAHGLDPPRPFRSGLALAELGVLPLIAGLTGLIRPLSGLVFVGIFAAVGALRALLAYHELVSLRRSADRELRLGRLYLHSPVVAWRSAELTSARQRNALARAVARIEREVSPATLPGASPLNRVAIRPHVDLFRQLAERLEALDRAVTPLAVLLVNDLLTTPESPLFARERAGELRACLVGCLDALDPGPYATQLAAIENNAKAVAGGC